ncbi:hypothetical protein MTR_7g070160 [Medicago truncatula]|uniref:Transmembrane protein n=1 Tax=Medicago truncatula TaxID=3880 RepID=G7KT96_MEDTR|nr:hypothetical protein MTR_7g070160 [Medicago truncatula]
MRSFLHWLFVLCMKKLSLMIHDQVTSNVWSEVKICNGGPIFSHLLFGNDHLVFTEAKCFQVKLVRNVLQLLISISTNCRI